MPAMQAASASKRTMYSGPRSEFYEIEDQLYMHIHGLRQRKQAVTVRCVVERLCELKPEAREKSFFSLQKWVYRFMERRSLSLRRVTRNVAISDPILQSRLTNFNEEVADIYFAMRDTVWLNMDQTGVQYEMPMRTTIDFLGVRAVPVQTGGSSGSRVTVALTVASNGEKLPAMIVFKGTTSGRICREFTSQALAYPRDIIYTVQQNAWTDETVMLHWIAKVLRPFSEPRTGSRFCLILDSLTAHRTPNVVRELNSLGIIILYIPGGLTSHVQPLDVGINAPFKHWIRESWSRYAHNERLSPADKRVKISQIISNAWQRIDSQTIQRSFNNILQACVTDAGELDEVDISLQEPQDE